VISQAVTLMERLGLTDEELVTVVDADPLSVITDELDHRPEIGILLALTAEDDPGLLRRWLRASGPAGRPIELLLRRDFAAFEDAHEQLATRGFVVRRAPGGPGR
jgi:hypothetical protein